MERFIASIKVKPLPNESSADYRDRTELTTEEEYRTLAYLKNASNQAAESLICALDNLARSAAAYLEIPTNRAIGGKYVADKLSLLEAIRAVANWQRHHHDWPEYEERRIELRFSAKNWTHRTLKMFGLFTFGEDIPIRFLTLLRISSYLQLGALSRLQCATCSA